MFYLNNKVEFSNSTPTHPNIKIQKVFDVVATISNLDRDIFIIFEMQILDRIRDNAR
jgi:hypothetical protein